MNILQWTAVISL